MKKLWFKWNELTATFWFIPVVIIIFSILLSIGLVYVDGLVNSPRDGLARFFFVSSSNSARTILSTISGAMMGVAGTVFSITLVALTLASSQFGPRLIKNFMYIRLNQVVLGAYISTYLYCLLVLNAIKDGDDYTFIPSIAILVAIIAAIGNIVLLIVFIHRIAISIQAGSVISEISDFIGRQVKTLFPSEMGKDEGDTESFDPLAAVSGYRKQISIQSPTSGYLQYVDSEALMEIITENESLLELHHRPGNHVVKGAEIGVLFTNSEWTEKSMGKIVSQLVIGRTKTAQQDLEFSFHQMVEIAARALSPGVNDPYTAITCIDNLTAIMCRLAQARFPSKYRFDESGTLRVIADTLEFERLLDVAFNQIRLFSGGSTAVIVRLMDGLTTIYGFAGKERYRRAVVRHAGMVLRVGEETINEENDLDDLNRRAEQILHRQ